MTDDGPCFFCGKTLTDVDGLIECQEGCGAYEKYHCNDEGAIIDIKWVVPQEVVFQLTKKGYLKGDLYIPEGSK
jgi:hypothetical protein